MKLAERFRPAGERFIDQGSCGAQLRQNPQRVFAIHVHTILLAEYGVDALGVFGGRATQKVAAVDDLRY
jgi:hypothetical protein